VDRSVAQGRPADPRTDLAAERWPDARVARRVAIVVGVLLALAALAVYGATYTERYYDHFVWQAAAFLEGHAAIRYPVAPHDGLLGNAYLQDVLPIATTDGTPRGLLPFPPLPAVVLLPFVALWGLSTNAQAIFIVLAAIDVAICWWAIGRLPVGIAVRLGTTVFFAFGTVFWYTAQVATTWYQAHIVAVGLTFLAIGLAVGADPAAVDGELGPSPLVRAARRWSARLAVDRRQFVAGFLFGLACTARLTMLFGAPFFAFVGSGGDWRRRAWSAGLGAAAPLLGLALYQVATTGQLINPAYAYQYQLETVAYPTLGYHADWGIEDPRYLPGNLGIALFGAPDILPSALPDSVALAPTPVCTDPGAVRGPFDIRCPLAVPRDTGMSVLLTSPAYLLAIPALGWFRRSRLVSGAVVAIVAIALVDVMHFSQGWVQFGYRFSNDATPFALLLVALGFERLAVRQRWGMLLAMTLVVLSLAVNLWGVHWSRLLGW
jgi:hypothetical protein